MKLFYGLSLSTLRKPSVSHRFMHNSNDIGKTVVVIGGGAAGYFSAIECASKLQSKNVKANIYVLEAGRSVLSKVLISGGGRCNVMHNPDKPTQEISQGYPRGKKELLGPITSRFGPKEAHDWFTSRGVQLKTEKDGRVFPTTDRSDTIADTLKNAAEAAGVQVIKGAKVLGVQWAEDPLLPEKAVGLFAVTFQTSSSRSNRVGDSGDVLKSKRSSLYKGLEAEDYGDHSWSGRDMDSSSNSSYSVLHCDRVIMATGSSRLGYEIVRGLGHTMRDPLPSLFSFKVKDPSLNALSGVSCKSAKVSLVVQDPAAPEQSEGGGAKRKKKSQSCDGLIQRGPLLVTRQGFSGPAVLKLSAFGARLMSTCQYKFLVEVSWLGDVGAQALREHFLAVKQQHPGRQVGRFFPQLSADLQQQVRAHFPAAATAAGLEDDDELNLHMYGVSEPVAVPQDVNIKEEDESGQISRRLWQYLLRRQGIEDPQIRWGQLSAQAILGLAQEVTQGRFAVDGRGLYRDEFVTCGGVQLSEVAFRSMESRVRPGLFLAGEVLDLDGITGGYNFQSAWTTGFIAGQSCALSLVDADSASSNT